MKEDKKELILETAERLFSELGYNGTSTRAIASEAGVNMAMLNYYFGSKEGLYKAIFERKFKGFHQVLVDINEEDISSWDKVKKYVTVYVDRLSTQTCFQKLIQYELSLLSRSVTSDYIIDAMVLNTMELKKIINDGIARKEFRKIDTELLLATLFGTKYYLINFSPIASRVFGQDLSLQSNLDNDIKPRMKAHFISLLEAYLLP